MPGVFLGKAPCQVAPRNTINDPFGATTGIASLAACGKVGRVPRRCDPGT